MKRIHDGDQVRKALSRAKMSKKEFAKRIGVSSSNLTRKLNESSWRTDHLSLAGEALGIDFFLAYCPKDEESPVLGLLINPSCLSDPELGKKVISQIQRSLMGFPEE